MKKMSAIAALCLANIAFAGDDEYMEVTAPNECCGHGIPAGLGMLAGWGGASGMSGSASLKAAALKAAVDKIAKDKKAEKAEAEKNSYDKATDGKSENSSVSQEIGLSWRQLMDSGRKERVKYRSENPDGTIETLEVENCVPSGALNPNKLTCTMEKFELFTDPTDGLERWAFTLAVVEPAYGPKNYDANANGWYPKVVDKQSFTLVVDTLDDLLWQLDRIEGRY